MGFSPDAGVGIFTAGKRAASPRAGASKIPRRPPLARSQSLGLPPSGWTPLVWVTKVILGGNGL